MRVTHLAFDLRPRDQSSDRIDDDYIDGVTADQYFGDLERLLTRVRLRHEQVVYVHPKFPRVRHIQSVLGVDEGGDPAHPLGIGDDMKAKGGLTTRLRAIDLGDPPSRDTTDANGRVEIDSAVGIDSISTLMPSSPIHMMAPFPWARSICVRAVVRAFVFLSLMSRFTSSVAIVSSQNWWVGT